MIPTLDAASVATEPNFTSVDRAHMTRALRLAEHGLSTTQPNPRVGCVLAVGEEVVGEGWHRRAGGPHAEVFALRMAGAQARGATAYVTLEPCGLFGRTPPCADALIGAGVARVVLATADAFQREGGALARLRGAGIVVESGLMEAEARALNRGFFARVERGRPWLRLVASAKTDPVVALSAGSDEYRDLQMWRARSSAIVVDIDALGSADPWPSVDVAAAAADEAMPVTPLRVVLDPELRLPSVTRVPAGVAPTLVVGSPPAAPLAPPPAGVEYLDIDLGSDGAGLTQLMAVLAQRGMNEVQVEASPALGSALQRRGLVDEYLIYFAAQVGEAQLRSWFASIYPTVHDLQVVERVQLQSGVRFLCRS